MNNIIDAKTAAEKLSLRELKALRTWIGDRIGRMEREEVKAQQQAEITPEQHTKLGEVVGQLKSIAVFTLFILLFSSCTKDLVITDTPEYGVKMIEWLVDPDGYVSAEWEYPDGRTGGTDFTDELNVPYLIDEQRIWPECTNNECMQVTQQGECWRHKSFP